jgi:ParB/RepB/Spo0J family partition protein
MTTIPAESAPAITGTQSAKKALAQADKKAPKTTATEALTAEIQAGLAAEVPVQPTPGLAAGEQVIRRVPLRLIDDNPDNPRDTVGDVADLAQSIAQGGLLQPVLLVPKPLWRAGKDELPDEHDSGRYVLIHGHRRRAAHALLELEEIDAIIRDRYVGAGAQIAMIVENFQREDLDPIQEAKAFAKLVELGLKQEQVGERVGCSQSHVAKRLQLLELPPEAHAMVLDKSITIAEALELRPLATDAKKLQAAVSKGRNGYGGIKRAVADTLQADKDKAAFAKVTADLRAQGIKHVKAPTYFGSGKVTKLADLVAAKRTTKAKHAKLPCHAVAVYDGTGSAAKRAGDTVHVCTDPGNHPRLPTSQELQRAAEKADAEAAAWAAHDARVAFLRTLVKTPGKEATDYLLRVLLDGHHFNEREKATMVKVLGVKTFEEIEPLAAKNSASLLRVVLAGQLVQEEDSIREAATGGYTWGGMSSRREEFARFAIAQGYGGDDLKEYLPDPPAKCEQCGCTDEDACPVPGHGDISDWSLNDAGICVGCADADPALADAVAAAVGLCEGCGCTLDAPCEREGHCENDEGTICTLVEGDTACSACLADKVADAADGVAG